MKTHEIEKETKLVINNIYKQKNKYLLRMKISVTIWMCCTLLALVNTWCMILYIISGILAIRYTKKYFSMVKKLIDTIEMLNKQEVSQSH